MLSVIKNRFFYFLYNLGMWFGREIIYLNLFCFLILYEVNLILFNLVKIY